MHLKHKLNLEVERRMTSKIIFLSLFSDDKVPKDYGMPLLKPWLMFIMNNFPDHFVVLLNKI